MRRVLIVGNSGSGKSTLARALGERLGLPVVHLDVLYWKPGWQASDREEFRSRVETALSGPRWICDGNFGGTWDLRMPKADTIIWLDLPPWLCLLRAIWRVVVFRTAERPDMAPGCREKFDPAFYAFIWSYDRKVKPRLEAALATHGAQARIERLRSDAQIKGFLSTLGPGAQASAQA